MPLTSDLVERSLRLRTNKPSDKDYKAVVDFNLQSNVEAKTEQGRLGLRFADDSKVKLTEHSTLIIDEYIYDPNPTKSKLALSFAKGTARFVTCKI